VSFKRRPIVDSIVLKALIHRVWGEEDLLEVNLSKGNCRGEGSRWMPLQDANRDWENPMLPMLVLVLVVLVLLWLFPEE
jgi:hypothetical protein